MLYLNPYALRYEDKEKIYIRGKNLITIEISNDIQNNEYLNKLKNIGDEMINIETHFGYKTTKKMLEENILTFSKISTNSKTSRTEGYYNTFCSIDKSSINLSDKTVLLLGAGALGTHIYWSLSAYNIKNIIIVDFDEIESSNLNRQLFYRSEDIGKKKIEVLKQQRNDLNKDLNIDIIQKKISGPQSISEIIKKYKNIDFIVKAIDTPRNCLDIVNEVCTKNKIPYISGGFNGHYVLIEQIYIPEISICYRCRNLNNSDYINQEIKSIWPTTPEMPQILSGMMISVIINVLLGNIENVDLDKMIVYNLKTFETIKVPYESINGICNTCKKDHTKNNELENTKKLNYGSILVLVLTYLLSFFVIKKITTYQVYILLTIPFVLNLVYSSIYGYFKGSIDKLFTISFCAYIPFSIYMLNFIFSNSNKGILYISNGIQAILLVFLILIILEGIILISYYLTFLKNDKIRGL